MVGTWNMFLGFHYVVGKSFRFFLYKSVCCWFSSIVVAQFSPMNISISIMMRAWTRILFKSDRSRCSISIHVCFSWPVVLDWIVDLTLLVLTRCRQWFLQLEVIFKFSSTLFVISVHSRNFQFSIRRIIWRTFFLFLTFLNSVNKRSFVWFSSDKSSRGSFNSSCMRVSRRSWRCALFLCVVKNSFNMSSSSLFF